MDKYYHELSLKIDQKQEQFVQLAFDLGFDAVEEKDDCLIIRSCEDLAIYKQAFLHFADGLGLKNCEISLLQKENKDWVEEYKASISPIQIDDIYIHSSWQKPNPKLINVMIDPALAFGSGHHPSTNACLKFVQMYCKQNTSVLDVGCGSGILAISAAKLGGVVDICDVDPQCIQAAKKNAKLNNISFNEARLGSAKDYDKSYDLVLANLVADIILLIKNDLLARLKPGGILVLSGIINSKQDAIIQAFKDEELLVLISDDEWCSLSIKGKI